MIRIDSLWLAVEPMDMRAGAERLLASFMTESSQVAALFTIENCPDKSAVP